MSSSPATYILRITNLVLIYALLARLILVISDYYHDQISVFWAPGGFALAALLVWGWKYWPGIFLGAVTASLMVDEPLLYALIQALSKTVGILLSIKLLQQFADFDNRLKNLCSFVLLALAAVCSSLISDFAAGLGFHYLGYLSWENFTPKLIRDWQSDILGIVLITPICLIWRNPPLGWFSREQVVETVVLFISCFLVGQVIFLNWFQSLVGSISLGYWMFMLIVWVAIRRGLHGALLFVCITGIQAVLGSMLGVGFFAHDIVGTGLQNFWFYMLSLQFAGITLATYVETRKDTEARLLGSETQLRLSQEYGGIGSWEADLATNCQSWSATCISMLGFPQLSNPTWADFLAAVHPDDQQKIIDTTRLHIEQGKAYELEYRLVLTDGEIRWMQSTGQAERDKTGKAIFMRGVVLDITERKRAEQALQSTRNQLEAFIKQAPIAIAMFDRNMNYLANSDKWLIEFGRGYESLIGFNHYRVHSNIPAEWPQVHQKALTGEIVRNDEDVWEQADGSLIWLRWTVSPWIDQFEEIGGIMISAENITASKIVEKKLRQSEAQLRFVTNHISVFIAQLDNQQRYKFVNQPYANLFGLHPADIISKHTREIMGEEAYIQAKPYIDLVLSGLKTEYDQELLETPLGSLVVTVQYLPEYDDDGDVIGFIVAISDITERYKMEREILQLNADLEQKVSERTAQLVVANQAKSAFLANMSHEIRTPMNVIIGLSSLVLDTSLTAQQRDYLDKVQAASKALLSLINDILDYSKIEAGHLNFEMTRFRLEDTISNTLNLFAIILAEKGLTQVTELSAALPEYVIGDSLRLGQVLNNLLGNAIKFTQQGEIKIKVEPERQPEQEGLHVILRFSISDTGIGITDEAVQRLFSPFTQADNTISRLYGGTGLGLSIAKSLVELMGGEITVSSQSGEGTTFSFTACFNQANQYEQPLAMQIPGTGKYPDLSSAIEGAEILLVENDAINQLVAMGFLKKMKLNVTLADNGMDALEWLAKKHFDAVLMDLQMPGMDGFEVTRKIREMPEGRMLPIIATTANAMIATIQACLDAGMNAHLSKPLNFTLLKSTLFHWLAPLHQQPASLDSAESAMEIVLPDWVEVNKESLNPILLELERLLGENMLQAKLVAEQVETVLDGTVWFADFQIVANLVRKMRYKAALAACQSFTIRFGSKTENI